MMKHQDLAGNFIFYDYLAKKRNPSFLDRNLLQAWAINQQQITGLEPAIPQPGFDQRGWNRRNWEMPSNGQLKNLVEQTGMNEAFVLDIKGIEPLNLRKHSSSRRPPKKKGPLFSIAVDLCIRLLDPDTGETCHEVRKSGIKMTGIVSATHGKEILLAVPRITVKPEELICAKPKPWTLTLSIHFQDTRDAAEFYTHVPSASHSSTESHTRLLVRHDNILQCPEPDSVDPRQSHILPFSYQPNSKALDFGLAADLYWTSMDTSILAAHNRQLYSALETCPMPSGSLDAPHRRFEITFVYQDTKMKRHALACPHDSCRKKRKLNSVDELRMHLEFWHDLFKYQAKNISNANGIEKWEFSCETANYRADQPRASNAVPDPRDMTVLRPIKAFNQQKYLKDGDNEYQKAAQLTASRLPAATVAATTTQPKPKPKLPSEVQDMVPAERKTYRIHAPTAPNITYFRVLSKRPLVEGEYVSESDDDVEMDWVELKKHALFGDSLKEPTKRLLKAFDPYLRKERLENDLYVGDAVLRFTRAKAALLWEDETTEEFEVLLSRLRDNKLITKEIHQACRDLVAQNQPAASQTQSLSSGLASLGTRASQDKGKGKAKVSASGQLTPQTADSDGDVEMRNAHMDTFDEISQAPPTDICFCGEDATIGHLPFVICRGRDCIRYAYHLDCLAKTNQVVPAIKDYWKCKDCASRPRSESPGCTTP